MVRALFRHSGEIQEVTIHDISTDARRINVRTKENVYGARWYNLNEFVKDYELIGTIKEFTEEDIINLKSGKE